MISLTEGVESIGPHPARDISELEARAIGHIKPPYIYTHPGTISKTMPDGRGYVFWAHPQPGTSDGATEAECAATAAFLTMAGNAHGVLVEALDRARKWVLADADAVSRDKDELNTWLELLAQIDAALNAAHGRK